MMVVQILRHEGRDFPWNGVNLSGHISLRITRGLDRDLVVDAAISRWISRPLLSFRVVEKHKLNEFFWGRTIVSGVFHGRGLITESQSSASGVLIRR